MILNKAEAKIRIEKLKKAINKYRHAYHVFDKSLISDAALDSLKHELHELERQYPEFIMADSPTQRVGGEPLKESKKVHHKTPMLSLEDVFDEEEVKQWIERVIKFLGISEFPEIFAESKFDGLAISLVYKNGILETASTRGDGKIGEDVTQNVRTIEAIPLRLDMSGLAKGEIEVRGEAIMTKTAFEAVNREQKKKGLAAYANPRNLVAGSIRQLDSKVTASRHIDFHAYILVTDLGQKLHSKEHELFKKLGFKSDPDAKICRSLKEIIDFQKRLGEKRQSLKYEIDGAVLTLNRIDLFKKAGVAGKAPRGSIAFKFAAKEAATIVEDIHVQVGRTGVLTPVAYLRPVEIGGVTVSRATLHNGDEIKRLGLKIGDTVIVGRAGDVIPNVRKVLANLRTGREKPFHMPKVCPICGKKVSRDEGGVLIRCVNKSCPSRKRRALHFFASKAAFDIEGLGPKSIGLLLDEGLIQDSADIFELKEGDLAPLERFGEKSSQNLIKSIQSRTVISLPRFLAGLGILHVGEATAQDLSERFGLIDILKNASLEELKSIANIGPKVAGSTYEWFRDDYNRKFLAKLLKHIKIEKYHKPKGRQAGKIFVLTGVLSSMSREEAKGKIYALAGKTSESVSKEVDYVVAGDEPGSKLAKAQKMGIEILDEKQFLGMIS